MSSLTELRTRFRSCELCVSKVVGANCEIRFGRSRRRRASGLISEIVDLVTHGTFIAAVVRFQRVNLDACSCDAHNSVALSERNVHVVSANSISLAKLSEVGLDEASSRSTARSICCASIQKVAAHALARIRRANRSSERCAEVPEKEARVSRISN